MAFGFRSFAVRRAASPRLALALGLAAALAACSYRGGDIGNPLVRKMEWRSYVAGDDIRAHCDRLSPDRFRVVYNGLWGGQLRSYDLDGLRRVLVARASDGGQVAVVNLAQPFAAWRAKESREPLSADDYRALVAGFAASGMFAPPPVGLNLPSHSYFWAAAYCKDGRYGFTAWAYPSARFAALSFPALLYAHDHTGVAPQPAGPVRPDPVWESENRLGHVTNFLITVGRDGPAP